MSFRPVIRCVYLSLSSLSASHLDRPLIFDLLGVEAVEKSHPGLVDVEIQLFLQREELLVVVGDEGRVVAGASLRRLDRDP